MKKNYILIIDDDKFSIDLYKIILGWTPYKSYVTMEGNATRAIEILNERHINSPEKFPDYILLDLHMPEMNGFEFIREFEKSFPDEKNKTKFIIITSSILRKDKELAFSFESVKDFLVKPIPRDYIEKIVVEGYQS